MNLPLYSSSNEVLLYQLPELSNGKLKISVEKSEAGGLICQTGPFEHFILFPHRASKREEGDRVVFETVGLLTCRYIRLERKGGFHCMPEVTFEAVCYPLHAVGTFVTDDERFNQMFTVSANTIRACAFPHRYGNATIDLQPQKSRDFAASWRGENSDFVIVDGARRDREVWAGDLLYELRTAWHVFADRELIRNTFDVLFAHLDEEGYIPASSISMQCFYEYNCWFVIVFYEYLLFSGDMEYGRRHFSHVKSILDYIVRYTAGGELSLNRMQTWAWTASRCGKVTSSNCVYYRALIDMALLCEAFSSPEAAEGYRSLAKCLKESIREGAYVEELHAYADTIGSRALFSLDASALSVLFDVAEEGTRDKILSSCLRLFGTPYGCLLFYPKEKRSEINWVHNDNVWPFVNTFLLEALYENGDYTAAEDLLNRVWGNMIERGATTFWEVVDPDGNFMSRRMVESEDDRDIWNSECHGWSAGLPQLFHRFYAGIVPVDFGYRVCTFDPKPFRFDKVDCTVPTAFGLIRVSIQKNSLGWDIELELPKGVEMVNRCNSLADGSGPVLQGTILKSGRYLLS